MILRAEFLVSFSMHCWDLSAPQTAQMLMFCSQSLSQVKLAAWTAVFVCLSGVANLPTRNFDSKNLTYAAM